MREGTIYANFLFFTYTQNISNIFFLSELQTVDKLLLKEPNSVQMIDVRAAKLSDYSYPIGHVRYVSPRREGTTPSRGRVVAGWNFGASLESASSFSFRSLFDILFR